MMKSVWIGLVTVAPIDSLQSPLSPGAKGAFVNILVEAENSSEYRLRTEAALKSLGLNAVAFEDLRRFEEKADKESLSFGLYTLAMQARETGQVVFSSFHNYFED
jgi:hypothetical protein